MMPTSHLLGLHPPYDMGAQVAGFADREDEPSTSAPWPAEPEGAILAAGIGISDLAYFLIS